MRTGEAVLLHGYMFYKCDSCGAVYQMWLETGVENRTHWTFNSCIHKPAPFCIGCPCGGEARYIDQHLDRERVSYITLDNGKCYFANIEGVEFGVPHFSTVGGNCI